MIHLFIFCLLTSLAIQAIYISIHWRGMILHKLHPYLIDLPDWIGKPLCNCVICMASVWTVIFWLLLTSVEGWKFLNPPFHGGFRGVVFCILVVAGLNAILGQLIELLRSFLELEQ